MIALRHVTKRFGGRVALDDVSLTVEPGATHVLLGSSGAGKSTVLRLILGLLSPDAGEVRVEPTAPMGYVVQEGALYPHLSAGRNVVLPAHAANWSAERQAARLDALAVLVGLEPELMARYPHQLSGGQRQRVSLMRALMLDPPVLLLDEPLGALDPVVRADLQRELREIFSRLGKTVVMVTHDVAEAALFGTTIALMTRGRIVQQGRFEQVGEAKADRRFGLGGTGIVYRALETGEIDVYPEYTGTISRAILNDPSLDTLDAIRAPLARRGLVVSAPLGFENTYALAMREDVGERLGLRTISDLARHRTLRAAFTSGFLERDDGWPGLRRHYGGLVLADVRAIEHALAYPALAGGQVDVIDAFSTDGRLTQGRYRLLQDDRKFFPSYAAVL